jgi:nucleoside phosphorylase
MMQMDCVIITIRPDEFEAVLQRFPTKVHKGPSGRTYGISQVHTKTGKNCSVAVVRSSEQGNDAAQQVAYDVINDLDPQMLLVVGIAGGVPSDDFTLGDVIISTRIDNLNVSKRFEDGKEEFDIRGGIHPGISNITASLLLYQKELAGWNDPGSITLNRPEVDLRQFETDEFRVKIADGQKNAFWYKKVRASITSHFGSESNLTRPPLFETGTIASSNSLIRNIDIFVRWLQTARNILAVEMESAGVYQATQMIKQQYPVMAIRGISDIIGLERDNQWTKYACQTAAAFAYAFVTAGIISPRENTPSSNESATVSPPPSQRQVKAPRVQSKKQANGLEPFEVFISYSEDDERFKKQLETHLTMLRREGIIRPWNSQQLELGKEWEQETASHIDSAQIILLLVSPSFLASDQLYEKEMMRAMERQASGNARVVPIILRPVDLGQTPFKRLLALPRNGKPVDTWRNADEIWSSIAQEIRHVCEQLHNSGAHIEHDG